MATVSAGFPAMSFFSPPTALSEPVQFHFSGVICWAEPSKMATDVSCETRRFLKGNDECSESLAADGSGWPGNQESTTKLI